MILQRMQRNCLEKNPLVSGKICQEGYLSPQIPPHFEKNNTLVLIEGSLRDLSPCPYF